MFFKKKTLYWVEIIKDEIRISEYKVTAEDSKFYYIKYNDVVKDKPVPKRNENLFNWTTDKKKFKEIKDNVITRYLALTKCEYIEARETYRKAVLSAKAVGHDISNEINLDEEFIDID